MDYDKTFAPVEKITTFCTFIIVASVCQWHISQLNVKNTFFNKYLQEEVYMTPSPGVSHDFGYVCQLKKMLYSLKQAPCAWFEIFFLLWSLFLYLFLVIMILLFLLNALIQVEICCRCSWAS